MPILLGFGKPLHNGPVAHFISGENPPAMDRQPRDQAMAGEICRAPAAISLWQHSSHGYRYRPQHRRLVRRLPGSVFLSRGSAVWQNAIPPNSPEFIFPGAHLPSMRAMTRALSQADDDAQPPASAYLILPSAVLMLTSVLSAIS